MREAAGGFQGKMLISAIYSRKYSTRASKNYQDLLFGLTIVCVR